MTRRSRSSRTRARRSAAGCSSCGASSSAAGRRRPALDRGAEEPLRAEAGQARARRTAPSCSSSGAATEPCSGASTRSPGRRRPLAIVPAGTANLFATNLGIPQDIEQAVAIGLRGERRKLDVGPLQRRALRRHGRRRLRRGDDPARPTARSRIASAGSPTSGPARKNLRAKPFKAKISVDGAPLVRRQGELHPRRQRRPAVRRRRGVRGRDAPTTASSSSASSTPTASSTGRARSPAPRPGTPSARRSCRRRRRRRSR